MVLKSFSLVLVRVVKKIFRLTSSFFHLLQLESYLFVRRGLYKFSRADLSLYKRERRVKLKEKTVLEDNEKFKNVLIENRAIFWPGRFDDQDLPWLYHEVFDDFNNNPSSYDHPKIDLKNAKWVFDAGCCEGYFSLFAFEKNPECKVVAFEPLMEMKEALEKTFFKQINSKQFFLEQVALGGEFKEAELFCDERHLCDSTIISKAGNPAGNGEWSDIKVVRLDDLAWLDNLNTSDIVVKMDIEGAEMDALRGSCGFLQRYKPRLAIAVYHGYENAYECCKIIKAANQDYEIEFRGMYGYYHPPRPYLLFAW